MNFLQLVQKLSQECQIPGNGPTSVANQTGESRNLVNWTRDAWEEIQTLHQEWKFRQKEFNFVTQANKAFYSPTEVGIAADFSSWDPSLMCLYTTAQGSDITELPPVSHQQYERYYKIATQAPGRPVCHAVRPDMSLALGPKPNNANFTISGWYRATPQILTEAEDVPNMPEEFHKIIVYYAMINYAVAEAAGEIYDGASRNYKKLITRLELHQLPVIDMPDTLA